MTDSKQNLNIIRRWNDIQRRNRLRTEQIKTINCTDENISYCTDGLTSQSYLNENNYKNKFNVQSNLTNPLRTNSINFISTNKCSSTKLLHKKMAH